MALRVVGRAVPSSVNGTRRFSIAASASRYSRCSTHSHKEHCPHCTPRTRTLTRTPSLPHSLRPAPYRPLSEPPLDTAQPMTPPPPASKPKRPLTTQGSDSDPFTVDTPQTASASQSVGSKGQSQQQQGQPQQQGKLSPEKLQQRAAEGPASSTASRDYDGEREFTRASAQPSSKDHAAPSSSSSSSSPSSSPQSTTPGGSSSLDPPKGEMWSQKPHPKSPRPGSDSRSPEAGSVPTGAPTGPMPSGTSLSDGFGARDPSWMRGHSRAPEYTRSSPSRGNAFPQFRAYSTSVLARAPPQPQQPPISDRPSQPRDPSQGPGPAPDNVPARGPPSDREKREPVPQRDIPRREPSGPSSPRPDEFIPVQTRGPYRVAYRAVHTPFGSSEDPVPDRTPPKPAADPTSTKGPSDPTPAGGLPKSAQTPMKTSVPKPGQPIGQSRVETPHTRVPTPGKAPSRSVTTTSSILLRLSPARSVHLASASLPIRMFPRLCGPVAGEHHLVDA